MKFPLSWLKDYLDLTETPQTIGDVLTSIGLEVDGIHPVGVNFSGVVVATVLASKPHPQATNLSCATVSDGETSYSIVCGAPNCRAGIKVALARLGAQLGELTITPRKLRGEPSHGMLCSDEELGLAEGVEGGIMELDPALADGEDLAILYAQDVIFEVSLTPNLAHCNSIRGIARELATYFNRPLKHPTYSLKEEKSLGEKVAVSIADHEACPRYSCRLVHGVKVAPSSPWLQQRIEQCGMRSVNNVVDAANFVMLELGQPLHTFDYGTVKGEPIQVRFATVGETLTTLDGNTRTLSEQSLLICAGNRPVALAGVMGSAETEVSDTTTDVLIESAYFKPTVIRRSAKEQGIASEASHRFERGVDPEAVREALDRAAALIAAEAHGRIPATVVDKNNHLPKPKKLSLRLSRIKQVLGLLIANTETVDLLKRMALKVISNQDNVIHVEVPTYRHDLNGEIDLIEEIARFYGYDHLIPKEPARFRTGTLPDSPVYRFEKKVRTHLLQEGLQELLTCDLISKRAVERVDFPDRNLIHVLNPSSIDQSILRPSLLPCHLDVVSHNHDHQLFNLSGFEVGRIHFKLKEKIYEQSVAAIVMTGNRDLPHWQHPKGTEVDFFALKGIVEQLLATLSLPPVLFKKGNHPTFHPGQQAIVVIDNREVGVLGQVHPKRTGATQPIFYAELNLDDLMPLTLPHSMMTPLAQFPPSVRDWTVTLSEETEIQLLLGEIKKYNSPLLESVSVLDLYRSEGVGSGWKSITLRFVYRDQTKTLASETVEAEHAGVMKQITEQLNGKIKS